MIAIPVQRIGVCVPARNEAGGIVACLRALSRAAAQVRCPVTAVVVADACTDDTAGQARCAAAAADLTVRVLHLEARSVGAARAAGLASLLEELGVVGTWLATTDADSTVPAGWLAGQLRHRRAGAELVVGTVTVADWSGHSGQLRAYVLDAYGRHAAERHGHVHGANLGFSAAAYQRLGGFAPVRAHEDVLLVDAAHRLGMSVSWAQDIAVSTSARLVGRTPAGFAHYLSAASQRVFPTAAGSRLHLPVGAAARTVGYA
jgi:glycosyltransferase involved in cell wall biosynthesis